MDGKAITFGLTFVPSHNWLRDMVPVFGQWLKVHNGLHTLVIVSQVRLCARVCLVSSMAYGKVNRGNTEYQLCFEERSNMVHVGNADSDSSVP